MAHETLWVAVTIAFIRAITAVICILVPNLAFEGEGRVPIAAIISPICVAFASKYVAGWVSRS